MLHSSSITARVNRKILGVTNTGDNRRNRGGAGTHAETPRTDMYRLKETEGARRPPRARQRHRTTGPHAIHQRAFQKEPQETDSQCTTKPSPYRKDTPGEFFPHSDS
jgi:hypothetical protein